MVADWEHHELRRSRRDLYHLSHEVALREAHAGRRAGPGWLASHDFRSLALLADAVETYAATSRTGSRPPDSQPLPDDGVNDVVADLASALERELVDRRAEAEGAAQTALEHLLHKVAWARAVLALHI